ncbi:MAG TPA: tripartite tricarboxylate transporter substrate binding protein [Burkholderiales bacterium]|nr:tripartite tricarboxylate transporter substrate binding protein [Burkholderiales bacterium]
MKSALWCASLLFAAGAAHGQPAWLPERAVEIIVPTGAGGINDRISRLMQRVLQDRKLVPTPMVVLNKAGGNQSLSVIYLTQKAPDPHYLLYATATVFTNQLAGLTPVGYRDLTPLACLVVDHTVITVAADSPIRTLRDLMEQLKADPGAVSFGLVSRGGPNHLALSQAVRSAGIDPRKLRTVVFKTNAESNMAVIGGHIQAVVSSASAALPQAQAGQTRMLAIAAARRATGPLAQVPTMREQGISATGIANWRAIFGTKGMSGAQIEFWDDALARMASNEEWHRELDGTNMSRHFLRGNDFSRYLDEEFAATRAVMTDLGLIK